MSTQQRVQKLPGASGPSLSATFIPSTADDFSMPAVVPDLMSPAPQRYTPEVPKNIQDSLSRMEIASALPNERHLATSTPPTGPGLRQGTSPLASSPARNRNNTGSGFGPSYTHPRDRPDLPHFSPFPKIHNRPPHVPPSDSEKEVILESSMGRVNTSGDPEMQLEWAEDVLIFADMMQTQESRLAAINRGRPRTPPGERALRENAVNIVKFLSNQGHPKAMFMVGMWYEFGKFDCPLDKRKASLKYFEAAERYPRAHYRLGLLFEHTDEPKKALEHYTAGYEAHDSASAFRLGMMSLLDKSDPTQNTIRGLGYLKEAVQTVDVNAPQAAYVLGMLQARELPQVTIPDHLEHYLPYDIESARLNIEKSAFLGLAKAQLKMGSAYELCSLGCEFDPALSMHYNALAAAQGEAEAEMALSKWFLCGFEGVFEKNEEQAYLYAERAAQEGLPTAEFALGYFSEIGIHVPVDLDKALDWYEKAAAQGNEDALGRIEEIRKSTGALKQDHKQVAIEAIRSRYGSQRGVRPERFQNQQPPTRLPTLQDEPAEYGYNQTPPNRTPSAAPYPTSGHSNYDNNMPSRTPSNAPYPTANSGVNMPTRGPANVPFPSGPGDPRLSPERGNSASPFIVQDRTNLPPRSSSTVGSGGPRPSPTGSNPGSLGPDPGFVDMRSASTGPPPMNNGGYGRPYPSGPPPRRPYPDGPGGPGGPNRPGPGRPGGPPSGRPGPGPGPGFGPGPRPNQGPGGPGGPRMGAVGPNRPPNGPNGPGKPGPPHGYGHGPGPGPGAGPGPGPGHSPHEPSLQGGGASPGSRPGSTRPPREDSLPMSMTPQEYSQQLKGKNPSVGPAGRPGHDQKLHHPGPPSKMAGPGVGGPNKAPYPNSQGPAHGQHSPHLIHPQQQAAPPPHHRQSPPQPHQQPPYPPHQHGSPNFGAGGYPPQNQHPQPQTQPQGGLPPQQQQQQTSPPQGGRPAGGAPSGLAKPAVAKPSAQTFEDMGVPVVKQSEDCIVM